MKTRELINLLERIESHAGGEVEVYFSYHQRDEYFRVPAYDVKGYTKRTGWYFTHKEGKASIPVESYRP